MAGAGITTEQEGPDCATRYRYATAAIFVVATLLRVLLCWFNPPSNSFDDHFEPISLILRTGEIPSKYACFQCYHPPVFYYVSAMIAKGLAGLGMGAPAIAEFLQFLNCGYNILTLAVIYLILKRLPLSDFARLVSFATVCFIPRHIYMAALHTNDSLTYLAVALCLYLLLVAIDGELSWPSIAALSITMSVALFVKFTAFVVIPMVALSLLVLPCGKSSIPRFRAAVILVAIMLPPMLLLGNSMADNQKRYGKPLPYNDIIFDAGAAQPRDPEGVDFASFTPWQFIDKPIIVPGQMHSFWTLVYSNTWFDTEPKFLFFVDKANAWWSYYAWLSGETKAPAPPPPLSSYTRILAAGLLTCGLVPLFLVLLGLARGVRSFFPGRDEPAGAIRAKLSALYVLLAANIAGIVLITLKFPVYSFMKASYLLGALPAFAVFMALGIQGVARHKPLKTSLVSVCAALIVFSSLHTLHLSWALARNSGVITKLNTPLTLE